MDMVDIVEQLGQRGLIRTNKIINDYYQIYCPIHNGGTEKRPSCGILLNDQVRRLPNGQTQKYPKGWTHCFSCGYAQPLSQLVEDILKSRSITKSGVDWLAENIPGFELESDFEYLLPESLVANLSDMYAINYIKSLTEPAPVYIEEQELEKYRFTIPYMYERKLTDAVIELFDVGFDKDWIAPGKKRPTPCLTFPVHTIDGKVLYIYRRAVDTKFFSMPESLNKPLYGIYQLPKDTKSVILCESIIDCLTCYGYGYPAIALMGTGNAYQIEQLKQLGMSEFVLAGDGDEAGKRMNAKLKRLLSSVAIISIMSMPEGKDINDLTEKEFNLIYNAKL